MQLHTLLVVAFIQLRSHQNIPNLQIFLPVEFTNCMWRRRVVSWGDATINHFSTMRPEIPGWEVTAGLRSIARRGS